MTNRNYQNGRAKEYRIMSDLRKRFPNAVIARSAGSHSPIDVWMLDPESRTIQVIQAKSGKSAASILRKVMGEISEYDGVYTVKAVAL